MEFIDRFGKKTPEDRGGYPEKPSSEIAMIEAKISTEKQKIQENLLKIGKQYMELHSKDHEACFAPMVEAVERSDACIRDYQIQILKLKGIILCDQCGAQLPKGARYCNACGSKAADFGRYIKCGYCGQQMDKGLKFCTACGKPLEEARGRICPRCGTETKNTDSFCMRCGMELNHEPISIPPETVKTCSKCGASLPNDVLFCTECGVKL